jgi:hypothetical protein
MPRPDLSRVPDYFHRYIAQTEGDDLNEILKKQAITFTSFLQNIPAGKYDYRYGPDKWTVKEVLQHIIDTERVFAYRALCIARGEQQPLPGFNEDDYAKNAPCADRKWSDMIEEFQAIRRSTELLFNSLDAARLEHSGIASGKPVYVLGIGFILAGHVAHHVAILKERYL